MSSFKINIILFLNKMNTPFQFFHFSSSLYTNFLTFKTTTNVQIIEQFINFTSIMQQQKNAPTLTNESSLRLSFLEQAASLLASPTNNQSKTPTSDLIARILLHEIKEISFTQQLRMHRDFKRSFCKKCFTPWAQAVSIGIAPFKLKSGSKSLSVICKSCRNQRRFKLTPNYKSRNEKAGHLQ